MAGKLYVVGVGPGDPELLTLKAARIIKSVPVLCVPKGREEGASLALSIIKGAVSVEGKKIVELHFPMVKTASNAECGMQSEESDQQLETKWKAAADAILSQLDGGSDAAFITIGDPSIYSTFFYLHSRLLEQRPALTIEFIPGISSITAAAAQAGMYLGLGNDRIAILPANYLDSLQETLERFDTVVLMKVNKVFDEVREVLVRMGLAAGAVYVARAGMEDERIIKDITRVRSGDLNYFSLVIVRKQ
ncbi:MAG: precorrin-2 C(20)-methyltransferase [Nitrospirota bacterium]|nr:precorrin-2 C(20)-methyltransferase [Nitrospirota bacterium]